MTQNSASFLEYYLENQLNLVQNNNLSDHEAEGDDLSRDFVYEYEEPLIDPCLIHDPNSTRILLDDKEDDCTDSALNPVKKRFALQAPRPSPITLSSARLFQERCKDGLRNSPLPIPRSKRISIKREKDKKKPSGIFNKGKKSATVSAYNALPLQGVFPHMAFSEDTFFTFRATVDDHQTKLAESQPPAGKSFEDACSIIISPIKKRHGVNERVDTPLTCRHLGTDQPVNSKDLEEELVSKEAEAFRSSDRNFLEDECTNPFFLSSTGTTCKIVPSCNQKQFGQYRDPEITTVNLESSSSFPSLNALAENIKSSTSETYVDSSTTSAELAESGLSSNNDKVMFLFERSFARKVEEETYCKLKEMWRPRKLF